MTVRPTISDLTADPHPHLDALRGQGPVYADSVGGWLVTGHADAQRILRDDAGFTVDDPRFSTAQVVGPSMLSVDGAEHRRYRNAFAAPFRKRSITAVGPVIEELAAGLVEDLPEIAELRSSFAAPLAASVIGRILGVAESPDRIISWYRDIVTAVERIEAGGEGSADLAALQAATLAAARRRSVIADALHAGLTMAEVTSNAATIMFGAIETVEGAISNALWHLGTETDAWAGVADGHYEFADFIEESLRLEPSAAFVDRYATDRIVAEETGISPGDFVTVALHAANRDPTVFDEPHRFDPSRRNTREHLTFAAGPHVCLGIHLARTELLLGLDAIVGRYPNLRLVAAESTGPSGHVFRKARSVVFELRD